LPGSLLVKGIAAQSHRISWVSGHLLSAGSLQAWRKPLPRNSDVNRELSDTVGISNWDRC